MLRKKNLILFIVFCFFSSVIFAEDIENERHSSETEAHHTETKFAPGKEIINHILDAHDWHICDWGEHHISIPLPVILLCDGKFYCFMSNKFEHGHAHYKDFALTEEGKIVHYETDGNISESKVWDFSLTKNALAILISVVIIAVVFISVAKSSRKTGSNKAPKGLQNLIEPVITYIRDEIAGKFIQKDKIDIFLPYLVTLFFFILTNNLMGLIPIFPGGANVTGNIAITLCLAVFTYIVVTINGTKDYWKHIFNTPGVPWFLKVPIPILPIVEFIGTLTKPIVLMIRLFANITAGHIIVLGFIFLIFILGKLSPVAGYGVAPVSIIFTLFISVLELLVAFVQAYIFTTLSSLYIGSAVTKHHHNEEKKVTNN
ncbi:ATP synthase subunit a [Bacteroidia bacterium]|nr:ATP synthase subunit a [Bacteroidia bacterium]